MLRPFTAGSCVETGTIDTRICRRNQSKCQLDDELHQAQSRSQSFLMYCPFVSASQHGLIIYVEVANGDSGRSRTANR